MKGWYEMNCKCQKNYKEVKLNGLNILYIIYILNILLYMFIVNVLLHDFSQRPAFTQIVQIVKQCKLL